MLPELNVRKWIWMAKHFPIYIEWLYNQNLYNSFSHWMNGTLSQLNFQYEQKFQWKKKSTWELVDDFSMMIDLQLYDHQKCHEGHEYFCFVKINRLYSTYRTLYSIWTHYFCSRNSVTLIQFRMKKIHWIFFFVFWAIHTNKQTIDSTRAAAEAAAMVSLWKWTW